MALKDIIDSPEFRGANPEAQMTVLKKYGVSDAMVNQFIESGVRPYSELHRGKALGIPQTATAGGLAHEPVIGEQFAQARENSSLTPSRAAMIATTAPLAGEMLAAPLATAKAIGLGIAGASAGGAVGHGVGRGLEYAGLPQGTAKVAGTIGGLAGGVAAPMLGAKVIPMLAEALPHSTIGRAARILEQLTAPKASAAQAALDNVAPSSVGRSVGSSVPESVSVGGGSSAAGLSSEDAALVQAMVKSRQFTPEQALALVEKNAAARLAPTAAAEAPMATVTNTATVAPAAAAEPIAGAVRPEWPVTEMTPKGPGAAPVSSDPLKAAMKRVAAKKAEQAARAKAFMEGGTPVPELVSEMQSGGTTPSSLEKLLAQSIEKIKLEKAAKKAAELLKAQGEGVVTS